MARYTVQDPQSGKKITFEWTEATPPTDTDIDEIASQARTMPTRKPFASPEAMREAATRLPEAALGTARLAGAGIAEPIRQAAMGAVSPEMQPQLQSLAAAAAPYARPALEIGGALGGAALTAPGNIPAPGIASAVGAGLGYAGGRKLADVLDIYAGRMEPRGVVPSLLETARDIPTGAAMELGGPVIGKGLGLLGRAMPKRGIKQVVERGITKGIRPSTVGQKTWPQRRKYKERAREAVESIVSNKRNLNLVDEEGNVVNKLPETLDEFSQAVHNTKGQVYNEYNTLAREAGKEGASVDLSKIADELEKGLTGPKLRPLKRFRPEYVRRIEETIAGLKEEGKYTAEEAQEGIRIFNEKLQSFYRNPDPKMASELAIDAMVANNMRKQLDDAIEETVGSGYQALKNRYTSLKAIEKDVNKRAGVDARKNIKGLIDFTDIFSGHEVVRGILTMRPEAIALGGVVKLIAGLHKHMNDPNRIVRNMFRETEKLMTPPPPGPAFAPVERGISYETLRRPAPGEEENPGGLLNTMTPSAEAAENTNNPGMDNPNPAIPNSNNPNNKSPYETLGNEMDLTPKVAMSADSAKTAVNAYLKRDYNTAIDAFKRAMIENPEKTEEYMKAISQAMKEQKALGKFGAQNQPKDKGVTPTTPQRTQTLSQLAPAPFDKGRSPWSSLVDSLGVPKAAQAAELLPEEAVPLPKLTSEQRAIRSYRAGDYEEAIKAFEQAIIDNPEREEEYQTAIDQIITERKKLMEYQRRHLYDLRSMGLTETALGEGI